MLDLVKGARLLVETCVKVKPGERVLVIADDKAFPMQMGTLVMDVANSIGAEAILTVMEPRQISGQEPPHAVAITMASVNAVIHITNGQGMGHTNARKEATDAGVRFYSMIEVPEDYFKREITSTDIEQIKERTQRLAEKLTKAHQVRVSTPAGTDIRGLRFSRCGRFWEVSPTMPKLLSPLWRAQPKVQWLST